MHTTRKPHRPHSDVGCHWRSTLTGGGKGN